MINQTEGVSLGVIIRTEVTSVRVIGMLCQSVHHTEGIFVRALIRTQTIFVNTTQTPRPHIAPGLIERAIMTCTKIHLRVITRTQLPVRRCICHNSYGKLALAGNEDAMAAVWKEHVHT